MLRLYNTLTRKIEDFEPIRPPKVGLYACGPTVYDYQHIGHMRRYVGDDILVRVLKYNGFEVKHVMNITDVGHLTSDSDIGEDKMEQGARKFDSSVWVIAQKFEKQFFESSNALNIKRPNAVIKATEAIQDQVELIEILKKKGYTYEIADGIYFDTSKFPNYSKLSGQKVKGLKPGARVEVVPGKKNSTDFALWKFSAAGFIDEKGERHMAPRQMEWFFEGPLKGELAGGVNRLRVPRKYWPTIGFPGWHIECSAMSMKALGPTFDIHTGGIDHIPIHHTNEIAQSEVATGKPFVNYWIHHAFLLVDGQKMSKSLKNTYTVEDVVKRGFDPLTLRHLYLQTHYRQEMNFTWDALEASQKALERLRGEVSTFDKPKIARLQLPSQSDGGQGCAEYEEKFEAAINNDLNMPEALAIVWELVHSDYPTHAKAESLFKFDEVLGLNLNQISKIKSQKEEIPEEVQKIIKERDELRKKKRFHLADQMRNKIINLGYEVHDDNGTTVVKKV